MNSKGSNRRVASVTVNGVEGLSGPAERIFLMAWFAIDVINYQGEWSMDGLGAAVPSSPGPQPQELATSQPPDCQEPLIDLRDDTTDAVVAVQNRKVEPLDEQTAPLLAQDFGTSLGQLLTVLSDALYTGSIEEYLERPDGVQKLLTILPESFTRRVQNDMGELLSLMSHRHLGKLLRDAVSALKHDADAKYTKMILAQYMTQMEQVFVEQIFTPIEETKRMSGQDYQRVRMFDALLDLRLLIWERDRCDIDGLPVLGGNPWESSELLASLALYHGHTYQHVAKKEGESGNSNDQNRLRRPGLILDAFHPPWRKYCHEGEAVTVRMPRSSWLPEDITAETDKLDALESGFYSLSDSQYLHIGDAIGTAKFSVFLTTTLQFDFLDSSSLYEFMNQNHCLYVQVQRLRYSPYYFTNTASVDPLPDDVVEALQLLNIEQGSLSSLTREQLRGRFRRLAREHHPDKTHSTCAEAFLRVSQAEETLSQWLQGLWVDIDTQASK